MTRHSRRAHQRAWRRRLCAERLERRTLLAAVTQVSPLANSPAAAVTADLSATIDANVNGDTATPQSFAVHSMQRGRLSDAVSTVGNVVTLNPDTDFFAGELVNASITAGIQSVAAEPVDPFVWQFRTAVSSGGALFSETALTSSNQETTDVSLGDLDGDGDLDALVVNRNAANEIWLNNGGQFSDSGQRLGDHDSFGAALGDLDGDGDLDAFVTNLARANRIWINDGGSFSDSGQSIGSQNSLDASLGDIDGDGDLDAVVANSLQGNRVWINDGGVFTGGQLLGSSSSNAVVLGDLDADGDLDAFIANSYQPNRIWLNDGGQFADSGQALGNQASRGVALGDVDGDGDLDAFVANSNQVNRVWLNAGGVFTDGGQELGTGRSYAVSLDDLDADGDLDAWVANVGSGNRVWLNNAGVFTDSGQGLSNADTAGFATGDIDGDGDVDVFAGNSGPNRIWLNQNPTFSVTPPLFAGVEGNADTTAFSFVVNREVDTRGTASVDFAVTPNGDDPAEPEDFAGGVLLSGTLTFADGVASMPIDVQVVGDVVAENDEGFAVTISNAVGQNSVIESALAEGVIRNDDNVDLGDLPIPFPTLFVDDGAAHNATGPTLGAARDIEGDGQPSASASGDDATANDDEDGVTFGTSIHAGQLAANVTVNASAPALLDAWIDFNGDDSFDSATEQIFTGEAVVAGDNALQFSVSAAAQPGDTYARFRLSTGGGLAPTGGAADGEVEDYLLTIASPGGSGVFGDSLQDLGNHSSLAAALGDVDGDGDLDAVVANANGEGNRVWLNDSGQFSDSGQELGDHSSADIALGDVDGDGDLDAVVANESGNRVWLNTSGVFADSAQSLGVKSSSAIALGDLDRDGDLDAFVANDAEDNRVWLNDGGIFTDAGQSLGNHASRGVALGDLDNDGDLDAIVANYAQPNRVWVNEDGKFQDSGQTLGDHFSQDVVLGDLDGDGDLDAFVANTEQGDRVWLNDAGVLTDSGQVVGDHFSFGAALGDLDGDGDLDAFVANGLSSNSLVAGPGNRVLRNDGGVFSDFGQPLGDHSSFGVALGDLDGDGDLDAFSSNYYIASLAAPRVPEGNRVWLNLQGNALISIDTAGTTQAEGDSGTTEFSFEVIRSGDVSGAAAVNFEVSGSSGAAADAADFGGAFPSGVVNFAAAESMRTITISVVGDSQVELDEEFTVSLSDPTPASVELLHTTAMGVIQNDDLTPITVFLTVDGPDMLERQGVSIFAATLSSPATAAVTVDLGISGTASVDDDFTVSATQIVIPEGETTGEITVTAVDDTLDEENETVIVEITTATNAALGVAQRTATIIDDDSPQLLRVTSLIPSTSGFTVRFTDRFDTSVLNLFDTQTAGLGAPDVILEGETTGPVAGTVTLAPSRTEFTFIKTGSPLAPDNYTVTLRSAVDGFKSVTGLLLDGDGDGTGGDDHSENFAVVPLPSNTVTIGLPDFTRGPGQEVNVPADVTTGIPLSLSNGAGIAHVDLRLVFDPSRLDITAAAVGADMPAGSTVSVNVINNTGTQGVAEISFASPVALPPGATNFASVLASVPSGAASDIYTSHHVVAIRGPVVTDGGNNPISAVGDAAVHLVTYFGDVSGNGRMNAGDASRVARVAAQLDTGFLATALVDPMIPGDISGNNRINSGDASLVAQAAARFPVPEIPPLPDGIIINLAGGLRPPSGELLDFLWGTPVSSAVGHRPAADDEGGSAGPGEAVPLAESDQVPDYVRDVVLPSVDQRGREAEREQFLEALDVVLATLWEASDL